MTLNSAPVTPLDRAIPAWVPRPALHYLAHTEVGLPIRELAREAGCHASTILRQIRSFESRREDPLVDAALCRLGRHVRPKRPGSPLKETRMTSPQTNAPTDDTLTEAQLRKDGAQVLRRLCETGAFLVVAANMDKAVILRDRGSQDPTRTGIVEKPVAEALALKGWIHCASAGRIARYAITAAGRNMLGHLLAEAENSAMGFADAQAPFSGTDAPGNTATSRRKRYAATESPLAVLARRRDHEGQPFLTGELVRAGERLREDFELARMGERATQNWDSYLTGETRAPTAEPGARPRSVARARTASALRDLGPGLGDVALRCCCHLEGLEQAEKRMGWSARSGKVVLRIALQRLHRHYTELGDAGQMIG